jgi:hypothetical protein
MVGLAHPYLKLVENNMQKLVCISGRKTLSELHGGVGHEVPLCVVVRVLYRSLIV